MPPTPLRTIPILPAVAPAPRIQARSVSGVFSRWRWALVGGTQALFYGLPWLTWNGRPLVLFDLAARRFDLFGAVLFPQDLIYLTGLLVLSALLLFFATTVAGRVWCGFACPQTVYTELFQWIERRTEGDRSARLRLDARPWGWVKLRRRGAKHLAWAALAGWTGFTFVGYFTPIHGLAAALLGGGGAALGPWEGFWIAFYGLATYGNAGWLRERVCQHMCPYGRFQGAMLDADTWLVSYDSARGEPRGARPRGSAAAARGQGDCVDCTLCVQVCPVGIDIRQGLQAACIHCGLCIDACNRVMDQLGAPRGLIRLATQAGQAVGASPGRALAGLWRRRRVQVYGGLLVLIGALWVAGLATRPALRVNALKDRGVMARPVAGGRVENVYRLQLMNASAVPREVRLAVRGAPGESLRLLPHPPVALAPAAAEPVVVTVQLGAEAAQAQADRVLPIEFVVHDGATGAEARTASTFLVPR